MSWHQIFHELRIFLLAIFGVSLLLIFFFVGGEASHRTYNGDALAILMVIMSFWMCHLSGEVLWDDTGVRTKSQRLWISLEVVALLLAAFPLMYFGLKIIASEVTYLDWQSPFTMIPITVIATGLVCYFGYRSRPMIWS